MADLITNIREAVTWLLSLFSTFMTTIQSKPVLLYVVLVGILGIAVPIVFRVLRSFGLRRGRR